MRLELPMVVRITEVRTEHQSQEINKENIGSEDITNLLELKATHFRIYPIC